MPEELRFYSFFDVD